MLSFKLRNDLEELPIFKVYEVKPVDVIAYPICKKCKRIPAINLIHMYKVGMESLRYDNLFLCRGCFKRLNGPIEELKQKVCT